MFLWYNFKSLISVQEKNCSPSVKNLTFTTAGKKDFLSCLSTWQKEFSQLHITWNSSRSSEVFDIVLDLEQLVLTNENKNFWVWQLFPLGIIPEWLVIFKDTREPLLCTRRSICSECFDYDQSTTSEANMGSKWIPDLLPGFTLNCSMPACYHVLATEYMFVCRLIWKGPDYHIKVSMTHFSTQRFA